MITDESHDAMVSLSPSPPPPYQRDDVLHAELQSPQSVDIPPPYEKTETSSSAADNITVTTVDVGFKKSTENLLPTSAAAAGRRSPGAFFLLEGIGSDRPYSGPSVSNESIGQYARHAAFAAFVLILVNPVCGLVAFILAVQASRVSSKDAKKARRLGTASVTTSMIGILVTIIIVVVAVVWKATAATVDVDLQSDPDTSLPVYDVSATNDEGWGPPASPCVYRVLSMCFGYRRISSGYYWEAAAEDFSNPGCCLATEYYYSVDDRCYAGAVVARNNVDSTATDCSYVAFGECYSNRYYHGPCIYDGCCAPGQLYEVGYCYSNSSSSSSSSMQLRSWLTPRGNVSYRHRTQHGRCVYNRCCRLDETFYGEYCYHNDGSERRRKPASTTASAYVGLYRGRYYAGRCCWRGVEDSEDGVSSAHCCVSSAHYYLNLHCYVL